MPRVPDLPCAGCGAMMHRTARSAPEGVATCRPCRNARHGTSRQYRKGCRCDECRAWKAEDTRAYVARRIERDGVSPTAQLKRIARGLDPFTEPVDCIRCGDPLENVRTAHGERPMHKRCRSRVFRISTDDRRTIYERDGWDCQICFTPVDPDAGPGTHWFPSLDHIVPQSAHLVPDHSPTNLRCAHRLCNAMRGDGTYYTDEQVREAVLSRLAVTA